MKRSPTPTALLISCLLPALLLCGAGAPSPAGAVDADEIIAKNIEATGGLEKIKAIQTAKFTGKFLAQGMELPFVMTQRRPDRLRIEVEVMGMTMVQCYDGTKGWSINPMTGSPDPQPMSEVENKSFALQADMDGVLVDYRDKGYTVEYLGESDVEGTAAHQLRVDTKQGTVNDIFIDKEYFMAIKVHSKVTVDAAEFESDSFMSDFKEVDGTVIPFAIETRMGETVVNQVMIEKVEYGVAVQDSIFIMPVKAE